MSSDCLLQRINEAKEQQSKKLDLSYKQLTQIPDAVFELTHLTELNLRGNRLSNLPESISNLANLTRLYLSKNRLSNLPESISNFANLMRLYLIENQLSNLPKFISNFANLMRLYLIENQLSSLPKFISNLANLTRLYLSKNQLSSLPKFISNFANLTRLYLNYNQLSNLPKDISNLANLTQLDLNYNQLSNLPKYISNFANLTQLDLSYNQLLTLPKYISNLANLTQLDLSYNQLLTLPESISNLANLTQLDLSENQIKKIPSWLAENKLEIEIEDQLAFSCINLYGNPIEEPPLEVVKQGNQSILNYYSQIATQGKDYLYEAKMLIVGEGGAGKTTLAHKIQDTNCPLPDIDDRTKGITINTHSFSVKANNGENDRPFQLNVWDFGGQEIYHATHRFFLSKRSLYVLVADNREDNTDFNYWLYIIELFADNSPIMIVLNEKDDLQRKINASDLRSCYPKTLKEILSVNFKTHEEKDNNKRQKRLKLIGQLISHIEHNAAHLPHIGEPVPALWVDIRKAVENNARNYISLQDFDEICYDQKLTNDQDIKTLLGYFHDLGIVLHFADNPLLRDRVILKPAWATNAVYLSSARRLPL